MSLRSAYRTADRNSRIFEVDHPATQAQKRQRLAEAGIAAPQNLVFVPLDFEHLTLVAAGFRRDAPAFFPGRASPCTCLKRRCSKRWSCFPGWRRAAQAGCKPHRARHYRPIFLTIWKAGRLSLASRNTLM
ncbi:class I SAM-dependent methyltransferase [Solidesulfovibrio sp. C21]|uniref:class I SAM-dependent methyltransferase n=1 Tax=Solidesulfovibrio sp. C21 TaxID=3398613 RepID=UPI0039FC01CD